MKRLIDSPMALLAAVLMLGFGPAQAADAPKTIITAAPAKAAGKKPITPVAKPAVVEPQPDPTLLIAQAHDAEAQGNTELALRLAQSAIVAAPAMPATYDALAEVYAANNQPEAARSYYSEALSVDPADADAQKAISALDHGGPAQRDANAREGSTTGTP